MLSDLTTETYSGEVPVVLPEVASHYHTLLEQLSASKDGSRAAIPTVGLTSCYSGEGVSTVASQLALAAANSSSRNVLLIDANLARPSVRRRFQLDPAPGLAEILLEDRDWQAGIQTANIPNLSLLTTGMRQADFAQAFHAEPMAELIANAQETFDLVVVDMPPVGQVACCTRLAKLLAGVLFVIEAERVRWEVAQRTKELLTRANVKLLGVVMNKQLQHVPDWLYRTL